MTFKHKHLEAECRPTGRYSCSCISRANFLCRVFTVLTNTSFEVFVLQHGASANLGCMFLVFCTKMVRLFIEDCRNTVLTVA